MDIGPHWTNLEVPDIIRLKLVGVVSLEDAQGVNQAHRDFAQGLPHFFYLIDLSELDSIPAAVRKEAAGTLRTFRSTGRRSTAPRSPPASSPSCS